MAFSNLQIDVAQLPAVEQLDMRPMPEQYHREVWFQSILTVVLATALSFIPVLIATGSSFSGSRFWVIPLIVFLNAALICSFIIRRSATKGYAVREHDVAFEVGLIWRKRVLLPINRVQHIEVSSGPLQRRFGLASLKFFTAGGASVDLNIDGLLVEDAERIRDRILKKTSSGSA